MRFCLILATLGRVDELRPLLESLVAQSHKDFSLIVVDQNRDHRTESLCAEYALRINIRHIFVERVGLSAARNSGLELAEGDVYGFPDDDCSYPSDLLETVDALLLRHRTDAITGVTVDESRGRNTAGRFDAREGLISVGNAWRRCVSATLFIKRELAEALGGFDEQFGLGAEFGAGEETDYVLRALRAGFRILYTPEITVYHADPVSNLDSQALRRAYSYGLGIGAVNKKHIAGWRNFGLIPTATAQILRPAAAALAYAFIDRRRSRFYFQTLKGRAHGFRRYKT